MNFYWPELDLILKLTLWFKIWISNKIFGNPRHMFYFEPISVSFFQVTPLIISAMFAGDPKQTFEDHEKVIRCLVGKRNPSETNNVNETRRSIHSVSGKVKFGVFEQVNSYRSHKRYQWNRWPWSYCSSLGFYHGSQGRFTIKKTQPNIRILNNR